MAACLHLTSPLFTSAQIAPEPPDLPAIRELYNTPPVLGPDARNRPLPSNDWWITLLRHSPFPGTLWVMPLTVTPDEQGLNIGYPMGWSEGGHELIQGAPLRISGVPPDPALPGGAILLFDFEEEIWPDSWTVTGNAFGPGPMPASRHPATNLSGNAYACSFYEGDQGTGTITSPPFRLIRDYMHLRVSGGNDPDRLGVELLVDGEVVHRAVGNQSNDLIPHRWDLRGHLGKQARLRLVDEHTGGWGFIAADAVILSNDPEPPSTGVFRTCSVLGWGDWSVKMGLHGNNSSRFEVTMVRGMPFIWIQPVNLPPVLHLLPGDEVLTPRGETAAFPHRGNRLMILRENRLFGLYLPENAGFKRDGSRLIPTSSAGIPFLAVAALPDKDLEAAYAAFAYTLPVNTRFEWEYAPREAEVSTRWHVETRPLQGQQEQVLQGWLPHHWRSTRHDLSFTPATYGTQRGPMKIARGKDFEIHYRFQGLPVTLPLPDETPGEPYSKETLDRILTAWIENEQRKTPEERAGGDTYWGGKHILSLARAATLSDQRNHPLAGTALDHIREALTDWFTYTPGETERYFARYPAPWKGVVGFNPSYGSENFSDAHFHHGQFILAAALLARLDPAWAKRYQDVAIQVARHYANWDRSDPDFPFLRTFSPWVGHSYAGGGSNPQDGNNQESTSEAMMSWAGLFLLGAALDMPEMRDAGAMGYAIEAEAVREYWNDYYAWKDPEAPGIFPPAYRAEHTLVSVRRDRDMGFWTWFSGEPVHIYGIQWLPTWTHLQYLGHDPEFVRYQSDQMRLRQGNGVPIDFEALGRDWGHVALSHLLWGDPEKVTAVLEASMRGRGELGDWRNGGVTYAFAHAMRRLGRADPDLHSSLPTSTVYQAPDGSRIWTGWNPSPAPVRVEVYHRQRKLTEFIVSPGKEQQVRILPPVQN